MSNDYLNNNAITSYALRNCNGIRLSSDSTLTVIARLYGDLRGDIRNELSGGQEIKRIDFWCFGKIAEGSSLPTLLKGTEITGVRANIIEGNVKIESVEGAVGDPKIDFVRIGFTDEEGFDNIPEPPEGWPTKGEMDIGTESDPLMLVTPSGVDITSDIRSMDDLYVDLDVGGKTTTLRNVPPTGGTYGYSTGTLTHRFQVTGQTGTLGNLFASADNGGYLDTSTGMLLVSSNTSDYAGNIVSVEGASGVNEVDYRGRIWFNAGIAAATIIRLEDEISGEMIFNAVNNDRTWSTSANVRIDDTNVSPDNPAYPLVPVGGGTIGMVDGVGNNLGFYLHLEASFPPSGSNGSNNIDRTNWKAGSEFIDLVFYGPVRLEGSGHHVDLQKSDASDPPNWVSMNDFCAGSGYEAIDYDLLQSGDNTSLNVVRITACPSCPCALPLGEYRIIEKADGLKSDLGLDEDDPNVQPFEYYFTLID